MIKTIRLAASGDWHLGHPDTPTQQIIASLDRAFPDNEETGKLDLILIEGDVFDRLLMYSDKNVYYSEAWAIRFLTMCRVRNIIVRVVEGTGYHDWHQSRMLTHLNEIAEIGCDIKRYDTVDIEYIDALGIHVLYVPDEFRSTASETWDYVKETLAKHRLTHVDIALMHGAFHHQLPEPARKSLDLHNVHDYLSIVRRYIFIGHVHVYSQYERALAAGSIEGLRHGEESPKGHIRVTMHPDMGKDLIQFIHNKEAIVYRTIDCSGLTEVRAREKIDRELKTLPKGSRIRLRAGRSDMTYNLVNQYISRHPEYKWKYEELAEMDTVRKETPVLKRPIPTTVLNKTNITRLLIDRIRDKNNESLPLCEKLLEACMNEI